MLIVWAISSIGNVLLFLTPTDAFDTANAPWRASSAAALIQMLVYLIAGVFLVRNGDRLGAWLVSDIDDQGPPASPTTFELVAFRVIGLYFLISGARATVGLIVSIALSPSWETGRINAALASQWGNIARAIVDLLAGALLVWRVDEMAAWLRRGWKVVRSRSDDTPGDDGAVEP